MLPGDVPFRHIVYRIFVCMGTCLVYVVVLWYPPGTVLCIGIEDIGQYSLLQGQPPNMDIHMYCVPGNVGRDRYT